MRKRRMVFPALLIALAFGLAACGGDNGNDNTDVVPTLAVEQTENTPPVDDAAPGTVEVSMVDNAFEPAQIEVPVGTTVTWTNNGTVIHTATAGERDNPSGLFDSGEMQPGDTFSYTFDQAGEFPYYCVPHPGMDGLVIVTEGDSG